MAVAEVSDEKRMVGTSSLLGTEIDEHHGWRTMGTAAAFAFARDLHPGGLNPDLPIPLGRSYGFDPLDVTSAVRVPGQSFGVEFEFQSALEARRWLQTSTEAIFGRVWMLYQELLEERANSHTDPNDILVIGQPKKSLRMPARVGIVQRGKPFVVAEDFDE